VIREAQQRLPRLRTKSKVIKAPGLYDSELEKGQLENPAQRDIVVSSITLLINSKSNDFTRLLEFQVSLPECDVQRRRLSQFMERKNFDALV
jgi:hypothetical protein